MKLFVYCDFFNILVHVVKIIILYISYIQY